MGSTGEPLTFKQWADANPLRAWRKRHGVTVNEAAARVGVSVTNLQMWERGVHAPGPALMARLVEVVGPDTEQEWADWRARRADLQAPGTVPA